MMKVGKSRLTDKQSIGVYAKGVMHMYLMVGDNRMENVAVRVSDAKVRETQKNEQELLMQDMDEKAKKASNDGVVLEISKTGVDASQVTKEETKQVERANLQQEEQKQSEEVQMEQRLEEQNMQAAQRQSLENIYIS